MFKVIGVNVIKSIVRESYVLIVSGKVILQQLIAHCVWRQCQSVLANVYVTIF